MIYKHTSLVRMMVAIVAVFTATNVYTQSRGTLEERLERTQAELELPDNFVRLDNWDFGDRHFNVDAVFKDKETEGLFIVNVLPYDEMPDTVWQGDSIVMYPNQFAKSIHAMMLANFSQLNLMELQAPVIMNDMDPRIGPEIHRVNYFEMKSPLSGTELKHGMMLTTHKEDVGMLIEVYMVNVNHAQGAEMLLDAGNMVDFKD